MFKIGLVFDLPQFLWRSAKKSGELRSRNFGDLEM